MKQKRKKKKRSHLCKVFMDSVVSILFLKVDLFVFLAHNFRSTLYLTIVYVLNIINNLFMNCLTILYSVTLIFFYWMLTYHILAQFIGCNTAMYNSITYHILVQSGTSGMQLPCRKIHNQQIIAPVGPSLYHKINRSSTEPVYFKKNKMLKSIIRYRIHGAL